MDMGMMPQMGQINPQDMLGQLLQQAQQQKMQQAIMSHPEVHQGISDGILSGAKKYGQQLLASMVGGGVGMGSMGGGPNPGGGPNNPPAKNQDQQQQPVQQAPQAQQPQMGGMNPQSLQMIQQLLSQGTGIQQSQGYRKPGMFDYLGAAFGANKTPDLMAAQQQAQGMGQVGPNVLQTYATGQLPLTTAQKADVGVAQYKAQEESLKTQLEGYDKQITQMQSTQKQLGEQRGMVKKITGGFTDKQWEIEHQIKATQALRDSMQNRLTSLSEGGSKAKDNQEQYRATTAGNKFRKL